MESLAAFLVAATLLSQLLGKTRLACGLFVVSLILVGVILHLHATDVLNLDF
jgi:hypothetical protein